MGGGFYCSCNPGYVLNDDYASCSGENFIYNHNDNCIRCIIKNSFLSRDHDFTHSNNMINLITDSYSSTMCRQSILYLILLIVSVTPDRKWNACIYYKYVSTYFVTVDLNECLERFTGCEQLCNNTDGSYQCGCREGYTLNTDGMTCDGRPICLYTCFELLSQIIPLIIEYS